MATTNVPRNCGIYLITVVTEHRSYFYVGHSHKISIRMGSHRKLLKKGRHFNVRLQRCWNKYGPHSFKFSVIELCERNALPEREQVALDDLVGKFGRRVLNIMRQCSMSRLGVRATKKQRELKRRQAAELWGDMFYRQAVLDGLQRSLADESVREMRSRISKEINSRPEVLEKQRVAQLVAQNKPEQKRKKSEAVCAALARKESRDRRAITNALPEVKLRRSQAAKAWRMKKAEAYADH